MTYSFTRARWPLFVGGLVLAGALACRRPTPPAAPSSEPTATGGTGAGALGPGMQVHPGALPRECDRYRRALEDCMASPHFPRNLLENQRLALEQMMLSLRTDEIPEAQRPAARAAAAQNCRDSLSTLQDASKETCPEIFQRPAQP